MLTGLIIINYYIAMVLFVQQYGKCLENFEPWGKPAVVGLLLLTESAGHQVARLDTIFRHSTVTCIFWSETGSFYLL